MVGRDGRTVGWWWVGVAVGLLGFSASLRAETSEDLTAAHAQSGSLHRAAASTAVVLDVYRLALIELVPAVGRVLETGRAPKAQPTTPLPAAVIEVLDRMADSVQSRVPAAALPAVTRGYHLEVVDALTRLQGASYLGEVARPLAELVRAMGETCRSAEPFVDLFSRQRPIQMQLVDPDLMLDTIGEALDEVSRAERRIVRLRKDRADLGEQFQAFLRLEISLRHALDLIAVSEEAGLHIGFEAQLAMDQFAELLKRVQRRVQALDGMVTQMKIPPAPLSGALDGVLVSIGNGERIEARLRWPASRGNPQPAVIRISRRSNLAGIRLQLAGRYHCEDTPWERALQMADQAIAGMEETRELVSEEAPGRSQFVEPWAEPPLASPIYRVAPVNSFGIEGEGLEGAVVIIPPTLQGVFEVSAESLAPAIREGRFYRAYDAVRVWWSPSPSDLTRSVVGSELGDQGGYPMLSAYRVIRIDPDGGAKNVGRVPAGVTEFVDRPSVAELQVGVRYAVEAVGQDGGTQLAPPACAMSEPVRVDLESRLRLARLGVAELGQPTELEQRELARLADPKALAAVQKEFFVQSGDAQRARRDAWWLSIRESDRVGWLKQWRGLFTPVEQQQRIDAAPTGLSRRYRLVLQVEAWLTVQPTEIGQEIDRWWGLQTEANRRAAVADWLAPASCSSGCSGGPTDARSDPSGDLETQRAVRVFAWWRSRDPWEQEQLAQWWGALLPLEQQQKTAAWYATLSDSDQRSVHWPEWCQLDPEEREARLQNAPKTLPLSLWPRFLARDRWQQLEVGPIDPLVEQLTREIHPWDRMTANLRYQVRPLDRDLGFHLDWLLMSLGLVSTLLLGRILRPRRRIVGR